MAFSDYQLGDVDDLEDFQPEASLEPTPTAVPAAPAAAVVPPAAEAPKPSQRERELEKQLAKSNERALQSEQSAQYWNQKAQGGAQRAPAAPVVEEAPVDLLEALTSGDNKKFAEALKKQGNFVSAEEVDRRVNEARNGARIEGRLSAQFPAMASNDTPLFKAAAKVYADLIAEDPSMAGKPSTTLFATRTASAEMRANGLDPDAMSEDDELDEERPAPRAKTPARETETERVRRASAQGRPRGQAPARNRDTDDNELSREQKFIVDRFAAAGANITQDSYKARVLKGTRLNGIPQQGGARR